jgi:hypothetical protein
MASSIAVSARFGRRLLTPATRAVTVCRWHSSSHANNKEFEDQSLNTPLPSPATDEPPSLLERSEKGLLQKIFDKYSFSQQTNRILMAESFLQAASRQASDA